MISLLLLTIDRFEMTKECVEHNLAMAGTNDVELLVCDNGSSDERVVQYFKSHPAKTHLRINKTNEGVAASVNQLLLRANGLFFVLFPNDIKCEKNWLVDMVNYLTTMPMPGLVGIQWGMSIPELSVRHGIEAHHTSQTVDLSRSDNRVYGVTAFGRNVLNRIGYYHEGFRHYSLEDSDFNFRANVAGLNSAYLPNHKSVHLGGDVGSGTDYRKMKDAAMVHNSDVIQYRIRHYNCCGIYERLPQWKQPLE